MGPPHQPGRTGGEGGSSERRHDLTWTSGSVNLLGPATPFRKGTRRGPDESPTPGGSAWHGQARRSNGVIGRGAGAVPLPTTECSDATEAAANLETEGDAMHGFSRRTALALAAGVVITACGGDDDDSTSGSHGDDAGGDGRRRAQPPATSATTPAAGTTGSLTTGDTEASGETSPGTAEPSGDPIPNARSTTSMPRSGTCTRSARAVSTRTRRRPASTTPAST